MLDESVREIMEIRLKQGESILWSESADSKVRRESDGLTSEDKVWQYMGAVFCLGMSLYYIYRSVASQDYVRLFLASAFLFLIIYVILFSRGHLPNPFVKNNVGEQFDHYVITNQRLRLFEKNINRASDLPLAAIDHAFIMYPKAENFLTITFLDDPNEERMLSLNGVADFSDAVKIINGLVGHPRKKKKSSSNKEKPHE